ncbi:hypothetical protein LEP1GSC041_3160 [Leptospira noguchii str. 2006001870]|nr:hypothetical protein LEP1GSC041_3160 [Leptospira noguchii str. 2006001870]
MLRKIKSFHKPQKSERSKSVKFPVRLRKCNGKPSHIKYSLQKIQYIELW